MLPTAEDKIKWFLPSKILSWLCPNITFSTFDECLDELSNGKAGGENRILPEVIKELNNEHRHALHHFTNEFYTGRLDIEGWHRGLLVWLHKSGRPKDDPNNYRGINLMDVLSKVLCRILNKRLFKLLDKHGTQYQFGATPGTGCREGIFTLKTALHIRRNHNLGTHVAFIDLVKAFDTANHELLIQVLKSMELRQHYVTVSSNYTRT